MLENLDKSIKENDTCHVQNHHENDKDHSIHSINFVSPHRGKKVIEFHMHCTRSLVTVISIITLYLNGKSPAINTVKKVLW
jgi:hypothetical protein